MQRISDEAVRRILDGEFPTVSLERDLASDLRDARTEIAELRGNENADEAWAPPSDETCKRHPRHNFECRECLRHHAAVMLREQEALRRLFAADTERYREAFELARDMAEYETVKEDQ